VRGEIVLCGFPRLDFIVHFPVGGEWDIHKAWSVEVYHDLLSKILQHRSLFAHAIQGNRTDTGAIVGRTENLGHYVWQDLAGLEEILENFGEHAIKHLIVGCHAKFDVVAVFPELANIPVVRLAREGADFEDILPLPFQHLRPIGVRASDRLRRRILRAADERVPEDVQIRARQAAADALLVLVNLRQHNKAWVHQIDGHITVLRRLAQDVGKLKVVFDGFADTADIADAIRRGVGPEIETINPIGCDVYETTVWARAAHVYSSVVSTGLVFTAWLAGRPGVAHSNVAHLDHGTSYHLIWEGSCPPTFIAKSDVRDVGEGYYDNYDFEPDVLYRLLRELVAQYYPSKLIHS